MNAQKSLGGRVIKCQSDCIDTRATKSCIYERLKTDATYHLLGFSVVIEVLLSHRYTLIYIKREVIDMKTHKGCDNVTAGISDIL